MNGSISIVTSSATCNAGAFSTTAAMYGMANWLTCDPMRLIVAADQILR